jgi:3-oxoacyl-[acyl-carrier-protein] synthase-1
LFDAGLKEVPHCGQAAADPADILPDAAPNRSIALALIAARQALAPVADRRNFKLSIVCGTTVAGMSRSELFYRKLRNDPAHAALAAEELRYHEPGAVTGYLASRFNAEECFSLSTACSTGLHACGMAKRLIERGECDLCLALGVDALSLLTVRGFASLMLVDFAGCKPFDKRRIGISLGEAAGALLLASERAADSLGVQPLAALSGWGASADSHHMTAPHPDGLGARMAASAALADAGIAASEIGCIATHGTATPDNDASEIKAMRALFDPLPPFCSMKGSIGHTLAASGIVEAAYAVTMLLQSRIPATANFIQPDEAIGAAPSPGQERQLDHILKNSFGFGGNNASVVLSTWGRT